MLRLMLLGMQVAAPAEPSAPFDLHVVPRCPAGGPADEVVVCGTRDPDRYRLKPLPPGYEKNAVPLARTSLGGGTLGVETQQVMIGGVPSNRVKLSFRLPF